MSKFENYNVNEMSLSDDPYLKIVQEKIINGIELSIKEKRIAGRDHPVKSIDGYVLKPDCVYRAISEELYNKYCETGFVYGYSVDDEFKYYIKDGKTYYNNKGVDWYLGGVCLKYGKVIIECPASKEYFIPAPDNGCKMSYDPIVRHMKSSGYKNPVPMYMVKLIKHPNLEINKNNEEDKKKSI